MADLLRTSLPHIAPAVDQAALFAEAVRLFHGMFHIEELGAANEARALFVGRHVVLDRRAALRVHLHPDSPGRRWFERETVLLARLDHPGIRLVHSAGYRGDWAYRVSKCISGPTSARSRAVYSWSRRLARTSPTRRDCPSQGCGPACGRVRGGPDRSTLARVGMGDPDAQNPGCDRRF